MNKYVESYWAEELPNGVIHLLINTTERWLAYQALSDTQFIIGEDLESWLHDDILTVEKFLPEIEKGMYMRTSMQEKDQISFYWIPYKFAERKLRKVLLESEKD